MSNAFVYTELQILRPFTENVWRESNPELLALPGFVNKTWLAGVNSHSTGGFYEFNSIENARHFAVTVFPGRARAQGVAQTTRIFDAQVVEEASRELNSVHFGGRLETKPGGFVYTEAQIGVAFDKAPWREMNPVLKSQPGLLAKTWLSGVGNQSVGGFYAFDTLDNATRFATDYFPTEAQALGVAFTTRLFDASLVEAASRPMRSPFFL